MSRVHVIVTATSPLALLKLGHSSVVATAVHRATSAQCHPSVSVWVGHDVMEAWNGSSASALVDCEVIVGKELTATIQDIDADYVLIHDAQRPLTLPSTFDRVVEALDSGFDATRPAHVVVDTLKTVDSKYRVTGTVNRDLVKSLTSPEGFRKTAIDFDGVLQEWSLPLMPNCTTGYVEGDQESLRIREPEDVLLVESFLAWQDAQDT